MKPFRVMHACSNCGAEFEIIVDPRDESCEQSECECGREIAYDDYEDYAE